jgi:hypothetical protein
MVRTMSLLGVDSIPELDRSLIDLGRLPAPASND